MLHENRNPNLLLTDTQLRKRPRGEKNHEIYRVKFSIRELEVMAASLRRRGDYRRADEIDRDIMALLDRKICRKIVKRSRKE